MRKLLLILLIFSTSIIAKAQTSLYDIGTVQEIKLYISQPNWDYQLDTMKIGSDGYLMIDSAHINGIPFYHPGLKYKGNSSYDSTYIKNPIHIALDEFENFDYDGITDLKLSNAYSDPSMVREVLSYNILSRYMDCPRSNFARLYINNVYIGLYSNDEDISKTFCSNKFLSSKSNPFFKCNPIVTPSTNTKSNLKYISADSTSYFNFYEMKSKKGWSDFIKLCDYVTNNNSDLENYLDMDRVLWMLAFNSVLVNLDSYSGAFSQNYYLFKDNTGRFNPIVWDLNMAFGGFPFVGVSNSSLGTLSIANMQSLNPTFHSGDVHWPLINVVMNNPTYRKKYFAHIWTIVNDYFINENYLSTANYFRSIIDPYVQTDNNKFFTYNQFLNSNTENVSIGNYSVPGLYNLMKSRTDYIATTEANVARPKFVNTTQSSFNSTDSLVRITTELPISQTVYLYYRNSHSAKFTKVEMSDNNDGIYSASVKVIPNATEYYLYAENSVGGTFEPERAEKEFYTINSTINTGVTDNTINNIKLYPNPTERYFNIETSVQTNYSIKNILGEVMIEGELSKSIRIDTEEWNAGIYFITTDFGSKKLIINK